MINRIFGNEESLSKAIDVIEKNFAVVGILEEWDKTLAVLEHYVPRFFSGASKLFYGRYLFSNFLVLGLLDKAALLKFRHIE